MSTDLFEKVRRDELTGMNFIVLARDEQRGQAPQAQEAAHRGHRPVVPGGSGHRHAEHQVTRCVQYIEARGGNKRTRHPDESKILRVAIGDVIGGRPGSAITKEWNEHRITTTRGSKWNLSNLTTMLRNPRMAGYQSVLVARDPADPSARSARRGARPRGPRAQATGL